LHSEGPDLHASYVPPTTDGRYGASAATEGEVPDNIGLVEIPRALHPTKLTKDREGVRKGYHHQKGNENTHR
jgi:hypothetical protein